MWESEAVKMAVNGRKELLTLVAHGDLCRVRGFHGFHGHTSCFPSDVTQVSLMTSPCRQLGSFSFPGRVPVGWGGVLGSERGSWQVVNDGDPVSSPLSLSLPPAGVLRFGPVRAPGDAGHASALPHQEGAAPLGRHHREEQPPQHGVSGRGRFLL